MAEKVVKTRIQQKHDIEANWNKATNFIPLKGEMIVYDVDDTHSYERYKLGDGVTVVTELPFADAHKADLIHDHGDTYAYKNEATTQVTENGEGNVVLVNVAVEEDSFTELDPTVPAWAKKPNPPTAAELGALPQIKQVILPLSNWDAETLTQTLTIQGISADESSQVIMVTPSPACMAEAVEKVVICSAQGENMITFRCNSLPTNDITMNISLQNAICVE